MIDQRDTMNTENFLRHIFLCVHRVSVVKLRLPFLP